MVVAAGVGAGAARGTLALLPELNHVLTAALVLGVFGGIYLGLARLLGLEEGKAFVARFRGLPGRR